MDKRAITVQFGQHLRRLRERNGWSLTEMADRYGGSRSYLYQLERGQSSPTLETVVALADGLGLPFLTLLDFDPRDDTALQWSEALAEAYAAQASASLALERWKNALDRLARAEMARVVR